MSVVQVPICTNTGAHLLDGSLAILVSGSDLHKLGRATTHSLDVDSAILISSGLLNSESKLSNSLTGHVLVILVSGSDLLICSNTGEQLTCWMCVQLFLSVHKHWKATHLLDVHLAILISGSLISSNTRE